MYYIHVHYCKMFHGSLNCLCDWLFLPVCSHSSVMSCYRAWLPILLDSKKQLSLHNHGDKFWNVMTHIHNLSHAQFLQCVHLWCTAADSANCLYSHGRMFDHTLHLPCSYLYWPANSRDATLNLGQSAHSQSVFALVSHTASLLQSTSKCNELP